MARNYNRKDIWYIDYKFKGRRYRKKIGTSKRLAGAALKDSEIKIIKDELGFSFDGVDFTLDCSRAIGT